ncbi:MAG: fimbrillin family protein [Bacteroidales bacterium]|nr:fimbrillin family protein [Bacteroidales bacterium]
MKLWHIISLWIASAVLISCGKDHFVDTDGTPMPISFSAGVSATSKAIKPDDPTVLLTVGNEVSIFGTRIDAGLPETVFSNRDLKCDAVPNPSTPSDPLSSSWSYSPVEYWKDNGDYYFSAVYPFNQDIVIDNTYKLNVSYQAGNNTDMMVARAYRDASLSKDPVNLTFKHTTAAVRFLFGKSSASDADQYQLTSFRLENFIPSGSFSMLTQVSGNPTINSSDWTVSNTYITLFPWTADTPSDRKTITHPTSVNDPAGYTPMGWYYMVPQTLSTNASVRFSVSYNGGTPVETVLNLYGATDQTSESGTSWAPNQVYNYFITLNQSGVDLTVRAIPWDEVKVTTDDFNFE